MAEIRIAVARPDDAEAWAELRSALWPEGAEDHAQEIAETFNQADPETLTLLALAGDDAIGLAEAAIRHDYVNGCEGSPVAFLEGLYVAEAWRRQGIARRLVESVAHWGRAQACAEFASDAPIDNAASRLLHAAMGFAETETVVFFRRTLA